MIQVAVMGHGVVGSGVVELLLKNNKSINHKAGQPIEIRRILDLREFPDSPLADRFTKNFEDIVNDPEIRIVVETMGGLKPAFEYVKRCLLSGKSVVTSNKQLVAEKGDELLELAKKNNLNFLFEASVGGGIPILRPLDQCLAANEVYEIAGILNGTTNFILTKMISEGMTFEKGLELAQKLGYAERNPADDIEGYDACRKICILASLAFGKHVYPGQVYTEGISKISREDIEYAKAWGGVVKLIGRAHKRSDGRLDCLVSPMLLPQTSRLSEVNDVFNGILVRGDAIGDVIFYGRGAGKFPTASAVVADIIDEVKHLGARKYFYWGHGEEGYVADYKEMECRYFLRLRCGSVNETLDALNAALGKCSRITVEEAPSDELAVVTPLVTEKQVLQAAAALENVTVESQIRVADL